MGQSLIVPINHFLEQGKFVFDLEELVHLLLILQRRQTAPRNVRQWF